MTIEANETNLAISDVAENEIFDISEFKNFKVTLKNRNVDNVVEFPRKRNVNAQYVRADCIDYGNEMVLSIEHNRTDKNR